MRHMYVPKTSIGKLNDFTNSTHSACPFNDKLKQPNRSPEHSRRQKDSEKHKDRD